MNPATLAYFIFASIGVSYAQGNDSTNCTTFKNNLAESTAQFTACAINHSRPIKLCEACVDLYIDVLESYGNLSTFSDGAGPCINQYVHLDRLEIVETLYRNSVDLWSRAKCNECFKFINGTVNISNDTDQFNKLHTNWTNCIQNQSVITEKVCKQCMSSYIELDTLYRSITNENERIGACMDIVDIMNETRGIWSTECCKYRQHKEYVFIISTVITFITMILFYVLTKLYTDQKTPKIFKQSRFAESLGGEMN